MAARHEQGLCFNCGSKFTLGHKFKPAQFLCLLVEQDESLSPEEEHHLDLPLPPLELAPDTLWPTETPSISLHALT